MAGLKTEVIHVRNEGEKAFREREEELLRQLHMEQTSGHALQGEKETLLQSKAKMEAKLKATTELNAKLKKELGELKTDLGQASAARD